MISHLITLLPGFVDAVVAVVGAAVVAAVDVAVVAAVVVVVVVVAAVLHNPAPPCSRVPSAARFNHAQQVLAFKHHLFMAAFVQHQSRVQ